MIIQSILHVQTSGVVAGGQFQSVGKFSFRPKIFF